MSTQSGITVSSKLADVFKTKSSSTPIVIKISSDSTELIPAEINNETSTTTSISSSIAQLNKYLSQTFPEPAYISFPYDSSEGNNEGNDDGNSTLAQSQPQKIFISFIPDSAPIKQKMLYASTKNTLLTSLGSSQFAYKFAWTELDEVTEDYLTRSINDEKNGENRGVKGLKTEKEEIVENINQQSYYARTGLGFKRELASMSSRTSGSTGDILYAFDEKLKLEFENLKESKLEVGTVVIFNINMASEVIELHEKINKVNVDGLINKLESNVASLKPSYILYKYEQSKVAFIYTCPSGSSVKDRMVYAASKNSLISHLKNEYFNGDDVVLDKNLEVGDLNELEVSELESDFGNEESKQSRGATPSSHSSSSLSSANNQSANNTGLRFNKPKGPRRR